MSTIYDDPVFFKKAVHFGSADSTFPAGALTDTNINSDADIAASKLVHRHAISYGQANGSDVITETKLLHITKAAATVQLIEVRPTTAPSGGDKQFTVDIQKAADGSSSWSSLLSAVITVSTGSTDDTRQVGTLIGSPTLADDEALRVVITASGATGSQGQGFVVTVNLDEEPS